MKALAFSLPSRRARPPDRRERGLLAVFAMLALVAVLAPALPDPAAAGFADSRHWHGLPNALDVLSNLPFAVLGVWGLARLRRNGWRSDAAAGRCSDCTRMFFVGLLTTAAGSAFYHLQPDAVRLAADRAGMSVAFAGLVGLAASERVSLRVGRPAAWATLAAGWAAVWNCSRTGNVLPWALVQFGGMALVCGLALLQPAGGTPGPHPRLSLGRVIACYALAKLFELGDDAVFQATGHWVSGHSLKHVLAALAAWPVLAALRNAGRQGLRHNPEAVGAAARTPVRVPDAAVRRAMKSDATVHATSGILRMTSSAAAGPGADAAGTASAAATAPAHPNQFALLGQRRFAPFFWTQFAGAANDNLFKFAFTVMVTYQLSVGWLPPAMAGLVIGALFILPFLLFSATGGQLADKVDKTVMIRFVKNLEIGIMALAAWGFWSASVGVLLACTFLMGLHSTLFGPVKFALLPQVLGERELTGGNGMVEMGTFVAILLGNVAGGLLVAIPQAGPHWVAFSCVALALAGRAVAQAIPRAPATDPGLVINWNPFSETWRNLRLARGNLVVFRSLLGISWMWFFGAVFLSQFPSFAREVLHGDEQVASLLLVVFSLGIGAGSLLCEVLGRRHVEIGLVPLGAIGMSVFALDLYFASRGLAVSADAPPGGFTLGGFVGVGAHWRVMADLALLALFAGLYSVPMYALIQLRSQPTHRARIIAANNILNALFMIASAVIAGLLLKAGFTIPQIFLFTALANAVVAFYIFMLVPEYLLRFVAWAASRFVYRYRVTGDAHIPTVGAAVLVCNHVSFVDAVLLMAASPRPIRFLMDHRIFRVPLLGGLFRLARAIPIAPRGEDPAAYAQAFAAALQVLREGDLLAIFPEGGITHDGTLQPFKGGVMKILQAARAEGIAPPVVPMALVNLWGSYFSRIEVRRGEPVAMVRPFRRGFFSRVGLRVGAPLAPSEVQPESLRQRVGALLGDA